VQASKQTNNQLSEAGIELALPETKWRFIYVAKETNNIFFKDMTLF
jgi:hypothetical protein